MSSIDERIVDMKFNNSQFEAGIKATISSLDGLKQSLKFDAAIKSLGDLDKASSSVKMKINTDGIAGSVKATVSATDTISKSLSDLDQAGKRVSLKLDATSFQNGTKTIVDAAATLKSNLNFSSIQDGFRNFDLRTFATGVSTNVRAAIGSLSELDLAAGKVQFQGMADNLEGLKSKFEGLSVVGIAALATIGAKATTVGLGMAKSLLIDNPKMGLEEYETNLNSIQTILANTQSKGSTLGDVNGALAELNEYSDKTIYNFSEMARNIGTFTAAGVDLDTSTEAIKGISNLAALSGSNSQQASTAMYQLSQAMSTGKVSLMDWNSVVNAGMGGQVFQDAILQTARNQGIAVDGIIEKNGSFRDSLQEGWLTTEVMTETLSKFTGDLSDDQLKAMGYTREQIVEVQKLAKTANDAATKVKTFTQLMGTLNESVGSGWAQSMQLILGDFEEAKEMWTAANDTLGAMIKGGADARNKMLGDWNKLGGRDVMIEAVANAFKALMGVITPVTKAFREVFPATTGKQLYDFTVMIRNFTAALIPGAATTSILHNTFKLLFGIIKIGVTIVTGFLKVIGALFGAIFLGGSGVSDMGKSIGDFIGFLADSIANSTAVADFFTMVAKGAAALGRGINVAATFLAPFVKDGLEGLVSGLKIVMTFMAMFASSTAAAIGGLVNGGLYVALTRVRERLESFGRLGEMLVQMWDKVKAASKQLWAELEPLRDVFMDMFRDIGANISEALQDVSFNDVLDMVNVGLLGGLVLMFKKFFKDGLGLGDDLKEGILSKLGDSLEGVKEVLGGLTGTLEAMQQNLQADTLMKIAIAIGVLAASVVVLSLIDSGKLTKALVGIGIMFVMLNKSMEALEGLTAGKGFIKMPFIAAGMILLAGAIVILSTAVKILSDLSWNELLKGLAGTSVLLMATAKAAEIMSRNPANLIATGIGMIAVAAAIKILASAVADMAALSFGNMIKGLIGIGGVLGALLLFNNMVKVNQGAIATGAGLILLGVALKIMASAVADFAAMDMGQLIQGVGALGAVLFVVAQFANATSKNTNIIQAAVALTILGVAMRVMATAIGALGSMSWEELAKGLLSMAIALKVITLSMSMLPPNMLANAVGMVAVGAALILIAQALKAMGGMTWEEIVKGLITLGGSMAILAVGLNLMAGTVTGSAALLVAAAALAVLTPVLIALGNMTWEQLLHGIAGLAAVFIVFGLAGLVLAPVTPVILALGTAIAMFGVGLLSVGAGTLMFTTGLIALAASAGIVGPAIVVLVTSILALLPLAMEQLGLAIAEFAEVLGRNAPVFLKAMVTLIMTLLKAIDIVAPKILDSIGRLIVGILGLLVKAIPQMVDAGMKIVIGILNGIGNNIGQLVTAAANLVTKFLDGIAQNLPRVLESAANLIISFVRGLADTIRNKSSEMSAAGLDLAGAIIQGMVDGVTAGIDRVAAAAGNIASSALDKVKDFLGINSPSKEFHKIGAWTSEGMALGMTSLIGTVSDAGHAIGQGAIDGTTKALDINSPSKEFQKLGKYTREGFVKGLTGTKAQSQAAWKDMRGFLSETIKATAEDMKIAQEKIKKLKAARSEEWGQLKDAKKARAENKAQGKSTKTLDARIKRLTKSRAEDLKALNAQNRAYATAKKENLGANHAWKNLDKNLRDEAVRLQKYAGETDKLAEKIKSAKDKLADAVKTRNDFQASTRDRLWARETVNENTRVKTYFSNMQNQIKQVQEFSTKVQQVRKLGLNDTLYKDLLAAGPDSIPFINELIKGGKTKVTEFNKLEEKLWSESNKLGKTASISLYQAGVDSAAGLVKGLEKQQKNIERQMDKIAGYMLRSIKRSLGIKSPSREFAKVGKWSTEGLVKGLEETSAAAAKSAGGVGDNALNALKKSMSNVGMAVSGDIDMTPTIRPVLDLTGIKKDSGRIEGLLTNKTLSVSATYAKASVLSANARANQEAVSISKTEAASSDEKITFIQNNNSPKALSPAEIYRQTKNQLSVIKKGAPTK